MPPVSYTAPVVCPMDGPPLPDGAVLVEGGAVLDVGPAAVLAGEGARTHHVDGVVLPGLVNAATRFEHADARAQLGAGGTDRWDDDRWKRSAHRGVQEALRAGVTAAGDLVTRGAGVPPACRGGLTGDSFVEVPVGADPAAIVPALERALDQPAPGRRLGIAAPRFGGPAGFDPGLLAALADLAVRRGAPLRIRGDAPVAALADCGALLPGTSVEPARPLSPAEIDLLAERRVTAVLRPRSSAGTPGAVGMPGAAGTRVRPYVEAGVRIALGTGDERDPDVLAEAAAWAVAARAVPMAVSHGGRWRDRHKRDQRESPSLTARAIPMAVAEHAVRLVTVDGAVAAGWPGAGVLAAGRRADLVGVAVTTTPATVYEDLLEHGPGRQVLTVVGGVRKARRRGAEEPWPPVDRGGH